MTCGIYTITNSISGDHYVGSSRNVERRIQRHLSQLRSGSHSNRRLQRAFDAHGSAAFKTAVVETVSSVDLLAEREQSHIDSGRPAYNILPFAYTALGLRHSDEARAAMSAAHSGSGNPMYGRKHSPDALAKITARSVELRDTQSTRAALSRGHGWNRGRPFSLESRMKMRAAKACRPVEQVDLATGIAIKSYPSASAAKADGFITAHIGRCCVGERRTHKGFGWRYVCP